MLPRRYDENELRAAIGASPVPEPSVEPARRRASRADTDDDDDDVPRPGRRRVIVVSAIAIAGGLGIATLVLLGSANRDRYALACEPERAVAQQGRGFPPWGMRALDGEAWKPLKIAPETRCRPYETDDVAELARVYLAMIVDQATALVTAREPRLDDAEGLLRQALLLTRPPEHETEKAAIERNDRRQEIERLLGDVTYGRAAARLREAGTALSEAAKQFDSAAAQHPRHASDAPAWASHARKLAQELQAGPSKAGPAPAPASADRPAAPPGVALPVEPDKPSVLPEAPPPDAGVPAGGVLL